MDITIPKIVSRCKNYIRYFQTNKDPQKSIASCKKKGMGAYYSSGSRPNQTAESWGLARMYSYILGGPTRKIDDEITQKYKVKFIHK